MQIFGPFTIDGEKVIIVNEKNRSKQFYSEKSFIEYLQMKKKRKLAKISQKEA